MSVINRSSFAKLLWPGLNKIYGNAYNEHPPEWAMLGFEQKKSSKAYEEDLGVSMFGLAEEKGEADSVVYDSARQTYLTRYVHVVYGKGFMVTREQYEDNQYPVLGLNKAQALAFAMKQTKEINGANILNRAFNSSYAGGDGLELCSKVHPHFYQTAGSSSTWKNEPSTASDLSETSLEQACIDIGKWTDDRGLKIAVRPNRVMVPVDLQFEIERILGNSGARPATADRDINALVQMGKFPGGYTVNHYLTDTAAWFISTDVKNGLCMYQRRPMEFTIDNDFDSENAKFKATERYVFGWTDPRAVYGSPGA
jgi:hypothetical protein